MKERTAWQQTSYLLFDFLVFSLEAFILEKYCRNTRAPVEHLTSHNFPRTTQSVNAISKGLHERDQTQEETFTAIAHNSCPAWGLLMETNTNLHKSIFNVAKYIITNRGNSLHVWEIHLLVKTMTVPLISVYMPPVVWISVISTEYAFNFRAEAMICRGFTNHTVSGLLMSQWDRLSWKRQPLQFSFVKFQSIAEKCD